MIGLGSIGLLLTHLGIALGYTVYVVEVNQAKLAITTRLGAIAVDAEPVPAAGSFELKLYWEAAAVCAVFECAGSDVTASLATASAPKGRSGCAGGAFAHAGQLCTAYYGAGRHQHCALDHL